MEKKEEMYTPDELRERYESALKIAQAKHDLEEARLNGLGSASISGGGGSLSSIAHTYYPSTWYPPGTTSIPPTTTTTVWPIIDEISNPVDRKEFELLQRQVLELMEICERMMEEINELRRETTSRRN